MIGALLNQLTPLSASGLPPQMRGIVALEAVSNDALRGDALPARIKLLNWGANETVSRGIVTVGAKTVAALAANQALYGFDKVALDYGHNSLPSHPNFKADPRKVAAYGTPEVVEGDGLYLTGLSYTPSGAEHAREYCDLSPTPLLDDTGEVVFLHSVALCPQGEVRGLSFFSADLVLAPLSRSHTSRSHTQKTHIMDLKALLCAILGLEPTVATDSEIQTAAEALAKKLKADPAEKKEGEAAPSGTPAEAATALAICKLTQQVEALTVHATSRERSDILADALRQGKIVPLAAQALPIETFRTIVSQLPAGQVPVDQRTPEGVAALSAAAPTAMELEVCRNMGISFADFQKSK